MMIKKFICFFVFALLFSACSSQKLKAENKYFETGLPETSIPLHVMTKSVDKPSETLIPQINTPVTPTNTSVPVPQICSPLGNIKLEDITSMIYNPYYPPAAGSDDPHQGVDLSDVDLDTLIAKTGLGVDSIINGQVVMVMNDRFPYGNAVLIESTYDTLPPRWQEIISNEPVPANWGAAPALTCPSGWDRDPETKSDPSIFVLYAHMENPPEVNQGQLLKCGEHIGSIGMSGNALSPHLHIEIRYGPLSGLIKSMAHYDVSASIDEMSNYCRWRVSGWYRLLDPISLLLQQ